MVVNDNAYALNKRGALESIASKLSPTVWRSHHSTRSLVGAGLPAMVVNDDAYKPDKRRALETIASKPAPTVWCSHHFDSDAVSCRSWLASDGR
ncbi:hypothetical protein B0D71_16375 [Pseudomonas laurylsulfativorans]|uniref:Uncharacterized protein n=1 Tax=Pseudomonas laurylsulfativorans TaxID=1943631 RepID=A0A2S3VP92_9PSED|nr:hypothetical protein B0D71_16375 [Pseudomonas laurylsulfativorans]